MSARPNAELAYRVLDQIDADPDSWRQEAWISRPGGADCGTAGCFAGWACMLSGWKPYWTQRGQDRTDGVTRDDPNTPSYFVPSVARRLLDIDDDQADGLFHEFNTREDLGEYVEEIFGPRPGGAA